MDLPLERGSIADVHAVSPVQVFSFLPSLAAFIASASSMVICTPHRYASRMGIRPTPKEAPVAVEGADVGADEDEGDDDIGLNIKLPITVVCLTVQMAMRMKSQDELPQMIKLACAYVLPITEYHYVRQRIESGAIRIPQKAAIYKWCVKLDWISMLYQRVLFSKARAEGKRWYSQFGSDASSQSGFEYFTTIEESTILEGDDDAVAHLASTARGLNCFTTHRRAMPLQVF